MKDPDDRKAFAEAIGVLAETLGGKVSEVGVEGYWHVLRRLDLAAFRAACDKALHECEFMPRPKDLLRFARPTTKVEGGRTWHWMEGAGWLPEERAPRRALGPTKPLTIAAVMESWKGQGKP